ncbi:MAG TPA: hypothetical protein VKH43_04635 [Thermoanaerobaculia bacterium]|nr:hypothetical protein [Thermoanaerobaculia bacterium]
MSDAAAVWSRPKAISRLRETLLRLADDEHSMCQVAADRGIFCHGFRRWGPREFDRRWRNAIGRSTHLTRAQMEEFANVWQLAEQIRNGVSLACDTRTRTGGPCRGWEEFSNAELARFCADLLGENVVVTE